MSVRIYFDNSIFNRDLTAGKMSEALRKIKSHNYSLYISDELLQELSAILLTTRASRFAAYMQFIAEADFLKMFRPYQEIIFAELKDGYPHKCQAFYDRKTTANIKRLISEWGRGNISNHSNLLRRLKSYQQGKASSMAPYKLWVSDFNSWRRSKHWPADLSSSIPFEKFFQAWWDSKAKKRVEVCTRGQITNHLRIADTVVKYPNLYPYFHVAIRCEAALLYHYSIRGRRVATTDLADSQQLIYLKELDVLLTEDTKNLRALIDYIYNGKKKIMNINEFLTS